MLWGSSWSSKWGSGASAFLQSLGQHRGRPGVGGNPARFVELVGGKEVLYTFLEPDAETTRETHWYDTRQNVLYKRVIATNPRTGKISKFWKAVSKCT
jgi:hypothetical protein